MPPRPFLSNLLALAAATLVLAIALYFGAGTRWFGFYGPATLALVSLPVLGWMLHRRYSDLSLSRWPIFAVLLPVGLAALVQIGFWVAFFNSGPGGIMFAAGRGMVMPMIEPVLPVAAVIMTALIAWLVARGAMKRES